MSTLQTLLALAGLIYVLCVIVQAIQEVFKSLLGTKAATMAQAMNEFMGDKLPLDDIKKALAQRGLDLTALEHFNKDDFKQLMDAMPGLDQKLQGIVSTANASFAQLKDNVAANYDAARAKFQALYTRKNKLFAIGFSVIVVFALNANVVVLYDQLGADQVMAQAIAGKVTTVATCPQANANAKPDESDFQKLYQSNHDCIKQTLNDYPVLVRDTRYPDDWKESKCRTILGLLAMCILVSLGAPFWNDIVKGLAGINTSFNSNNNKSSS